MSGPPLHLLAANVGIKKDGGDVKLPQNQPIQLAFDRLLLPSTVIRQSFILVDAFNNPLNPTVTYDPIKRIVTLSNPDPNDTSGKNWLKVDQPYKILFPVPQGADDQSGVRAIDRATLERPLELGFQVGDPQQNLPAETTMSFCRDVFPIFETHCSGSKCHNTIDNASTLPPAEGLVLASSDGVRNTALRRVANESNTGPLAGEGRAPGRVFGVDMPIIAPGDPGNSWLLYKLLLAPSPTPQILGAADAMTAEGGTAPRSCPSLQPLGPRVAYLPLSGDERTRLSNHIRGNQMPYPSAPGQVEETNFVRDDELERIGAWIAQGAPVDQCTQSACTP